MSGGEIQDATETVGRSCRILQLACCKEAHLEPEPCVLRIRLKALLPVPDATRHLSESPIYPTQLSMIVGVLSRGDSALAALTFRI